MNSCVVYYIVDQQKSPVALAALEGVEAVSFPLCARATKALLVEHAAVVIRQYLVLGVALERNFPKDTSELCELHAVDVAESFRAFAADAEDRS